MPPLWCVAGGVQAYISYLKPLEWQTNHEEHNGVMHREDNSCYTKASP